MSAEENKALIRREYDEVWNQGKLDVMDELYATDIVCHMPGSPDIQGIDGIKQIANMFYIAFPDMQYMIEDMIGEGEKVAVRWTLTGIHKGALMGIPPTGKQVTSKGGSIIRFTGGKVVEIWSGFDALVMWQQLGVTPPVGKGE